MTPTATDPRAGVHETAAIPPQSLPRLFLRFLRVGSSRRAGRSRSWRCCSANIGHGFFERVTENARVHRFLDGVTAGVVGIMGATALELGRAGVRDAATAAIAVVGLVVLWRWRSPAAVLVVVLGGVVVRLLLAHG